MIRNLKVLGLALVAVFAMSAVVASAASAGELTSTTSPVTLISTETGAAEANQLEAFGGFTRCPGTKFTGHKYNVTPHELITTPTSTITITPDYGSCTTTLGSLENAPTTVDMGTCDFVFHIGALVSAGTYKVTGTEVCSSGHIQVTVFSSAAHSLRLCTLTTEAPAAGVGGPHLTNGAGDVNISGTFASFKVVKSGLCGSATEEGGKLKVDATIKGFTGGGAETGISISGS
jgi:hypothetical protein